MSKVEKTMKGSIMTKGAALDLTIITFRVLSSPALTILQLSVWRHLKKDTNSFL